MNGAEGSRTLVLPRSLSGFYAEHATTRNPPRVHSPSRAAAPEWRRRESNPNLLVASEALSQRAASPNVRTGGGVEPPQSVTTRLQRAELADAQRPQGRAIDRIRTGTARITTSGAAVTPRSPRAGTTGLEPATSDVTSQYSA